MLENLKAAIQSERTDDMLMEAATRPSSEEALKSTFLDSYDVGIIGAENDPSIQGLVETIPEYEEHDDETAMSVDLKNLVESFIPEDIEETN